MEFVYQEVYWEGGFLKCFTGLINNTPTKSTVSHQNQNGKYVDLALPRGELKITIK